MLVQVSNFGGNTALKTCTKKGQYYVIPHIHQFSEIIFVKEGSLKVTIDGIEEIANKGDMVFISTFRTHTLSTSINAEIWICVFSNDFINDFTNEGDIYYIGERSVFTPSNIVRDLFVANFVDSAEKFLEYDSSLFRSSRAAIYTVYAEYTRLVPNSTLLKHSEKRSVIDSMLNYIYQNYRNPISLASMALELGYTPEYLSNTLSTVEGMNFRSLVNSFRVELAKPLLVSTQKTMPDIAAECGFSCEMSFHRAFKNITGKTPGAYRTVWKTSSFDTSKGDSRYKTKATSH